jgi:ribose/xylose/arabinose/galactoside ABC-type transport system permease subunit
MPELGKLLIVLGVAFVVLGLALWSGFGASWLGRLPGDIRIVRSNSTFHFPIVTCIIISVVLSIIFSFFRR